MAKNFDHVSHIKSRLTRDIENGEFYGLTPTADNSDGQNSSPIKLNLAKRPSAANLIEGEIAVNYLKGHETLTIKNTEDEIVGFVNENEFNQAQEIVASGLAQEKEERISEIASLQEKFENISDTIDEIQDDIAEMELVVSSSLNDLNDRIVDTTELAENGLVELDNKIDEEIENITENMGNAFQNLDVNIENLELTIASSLNDLNDRIVSNDSVITQLLNEIANLKARVEALENQQ